MVFLTIICYMFMYVVCFYFIFFFFKQKTAYEMRISDWSSDVCSSDLPKRNLEPLKWLTTLLVHHCCRHFRGDRPHAEASEWKTMAEIGRASCRERVCQYV